MMVVVEVTYKKPLTEVDQYLQEHRAFLQTYYDKGILLASGPQQPRTGGIIIGLTDQRTMDNVIKEDPFYQHGIADYRIVEFDPVKCCAEIQALLAKA